MTTRTTPFDPGTPCWVDLMSSDVERSKAFYGELFGWTYDEAGSEFGGYVTFRSDGHAVAGLMGQPPEYAGPDVWSTYLATADVDATIAAAVAAGGEVMMPRMEVGSDDAHVGVMGMLRDPGGAVIGLWQAGAHTGFEKYNDSGSVTWDELSTKDFLAAIAFYSQVFGWDIEKMSDTDEFRYYTGKVGGQGVAGVMDAAAMLPPEAPSSWTVYLSVADVDAAVAKAVELGGSVTRAAVDSPFGRIAVMSDPTGALFNLHGPNTDAG